MVIRGVLSNPSFAKQLLRRYEIKHEARARTFIFHPL
jgi:hypothetical protein